MLMENTTIAELVQKLRQKQMLIATLRNSLNVLSGAHCIPQTETLAGDALTRYTNTINDISALMKENTLLKNEISKRKGESN